MIDLDKICQSLESNRCATHQQHPRAYVKDDLFHLNTCCNQFREQLELQLNEEVRRQLEGMEGTS